MAGYWQTIFLQKNNTSKIQKGFSSAFDENPFFVFPRTLKAMIAFYSTYPSEERFQDHITDNTRPDGSIQQQSGYTVTPVFSGNDPECAYPDRSRYREKNQISHRPLSLGYEPPLSYAA